MGPLEFRVLVLVGLWGVLGFLWLEGVFGVRFVFSLPEEVVGVSLLFCPLFPFSFFPFPLVLGLCGGLLDEVGAWVLGRGWGLPLRLLVFPFLPFCLKTFPFNLSLTLGFGERFIVNIFPAGGVTFHVRVPGGATFVCAVRVPGG